MRSGNITRFIRYHDVQHTEIRESAEDILLAQMEIFVIIVAVIAVVAALLLLVLLQIRIKKQSAQEETSSMEEVAPPDPNDPYLKTGPPPYIEVMKSPELYPLSSSCNTVTACNEANIQVVSNPVSGSKRSWTQLMTAIIGPGDLVPSNTPGKITPSYVSNNHGNHYVSSNHFQIPDVVRDYDIFVDEKSFDDVLPSYEEVCFTGVTVEANNVERLASRNIDIKKCPKHSLVQLKQSHILDTYLEKTHFALMNSQPHRSCIVKMGIPRPRTLTI